MLGQIDDDAFARARRQQPLPGNDDGRALARQPGVDTGIGAQDFLVAQAVAPREVRQRVFAERRDGFDVAEHERFGIDQRILRGVRRSRAAG